MHFVARRQGMCALRMRSFRSSGCACLFKYVSAYAVCVCVATLFDSSTVLFLRITITDHPSPTVGGGTFSLELTAQDIINVWFHIAR